MKTFIEIFIEHINELTTNEQLHNNVFIKFEKHDRTIYVLHEISRMNEI